MASIEETQASSGLGERLRNRLALAQTHINTMEERARNQWSDLPAQMRAALDRVVDRIRTTLDLPSRADVNDLMARIEELDRKFARLEQHQPPRRTRAEISARPESEAGEPARSAARETAAEAGRDEQEPAEPEPDGQPRTARAERDGDPQARKTGAKKTASASQKSARPPTANKTVKAPSARKSGKSGKSGKSTRRRRGGAGT